MLPVLFLLASIAALLCRPSVAGAQFTVRAWLDWQTVETSHFVFHYPSALGEWTRALAARAESIDSDVTQLVGYATPHKTHVVVDDPYSVANGSAWPFIDQPIIYLWASPPEPREDIGEFRGWGETLLSHEFTHIAHLTRPSRNARLRHLWQALPVDLGPIPLDAPRWVIEGYATLSEGRVTGSGRPHGSWRPAFLREWALEGQLPRYEQLDNFGSYNGGEFAYLAGSAFLEWLARRQGDSSLVFLWRRMTAKQVRGFDEAFTGVFGESARALYGQFTADLTGKSIEARRRLRAAFPSDTGEIVQRLARGTGDPAISRDGKRVVLSLSSAAAPSRIVIFGTAAEPDTGRARRDSLLAKSDPQDVPAHSIYPPPRKVLASLRAKSGAPYESPRFLADGRVLLDRNVDAGRGTLAPDLFIWSPASHSVQRVTHHASIRDADPSPDGRFAVGMQCIHGWCDVARVDLASGVDSVILAGSPSRSYFRPRYSPDGARILVSVSDSGRWRLGTTSVMSPHLEYLAFRGNAYDCAWDGSSAIVATSDADGIANIQRLDLATGELRTLTHVTGAAVAPEPSPADSSVWFLSLYSRGYDLRRVRRAGVVDSAARLDLTALAPAVAVPPEPGMPMRDNAVSPPKPFGLGARQFRWIPIPQLDADGGSIGVALASTDLIGRSPILVRLMTGDRAEWRGGSIEGVWRGTLPSFRASLFDAVQDERATRSPVAGAPGLDTRIRGALFSIDDARSSEDWSLRYRVGASTSMLDVDSARGIRSSGARPLFFGDAGVSRFQRPGGGTSTVAEALGSALTIGRSADTRFWRSVSTLGLSTSGFTPMPLTASAVYARTNADAPAFERLSLGGTSSPLLDRELLTQRLSMPALPAGIATGTSAFVYRVSLILNPLSPYWSAGGVSSGGARIAWHGVVGLEGSQAIGEIPIAGFPAARAIYGIGESLNAPFRRRVRVYASLQLNP
jgi:hypothetical protein